MNTCNDEVLEQPIFILSCVRSGSTLLRCIVDTHPDLCSPGHLNLGMLCNGLYNTAYYTIGKLPDVESEEQRNDLVIEEVRRVVTGILGRYALGKGKRNWCEKSTANIDYLDILYKVFPGAKYICLYRNCLDVANSCIKFNPLGYMDELSSYVRDRPDNFVGAMIDNWLEKNKKLLEFERQYKKQCFRMSYESLVQQPERVLEELFGFLGESWDEKILDSIFCFPHDQGEGDIKVWFSNKINKDSIGNGTTMPLESIPKDLMVEVDALHKELGYSSIKSLYARQCERESKKKYDLELSDFFNNFVLDSKGKVLDKFHVLRGRCKFIISGAGGGVWLIEVNSCGIRLLQDYCDADCTISTVYDVFCELVYGDKGAVQAYEKGEIVGAGNIGLALEFGRMIFS